MIFGDVAIYLDSYLLLLLQEHLQSLVLTEDSIQVVLQ